MTDMTDRKEQINFGKMLHGGDYNPEQWLDSPEILEKDIEYFKKAHINEVSIGIFSWSTLEPEEGRYCLDWMQEIIDRLWANGISVILATPSGARPKWMADKYPEVLRVDEYGNRDFFGARHNHCLTSPVYREKMRIIDRMLSERFGKHPAVIAWHISNELGGAAHDCFCPLCQAEFRIFLREKYGSIDNLNKAWATTFWSHTYNSFDQVEAPSRRGENGLHALNLDWRRFVTDRYADFIKAETAAIREGGSILPTTINMMYDFIPINYHKLAPLVDIISWDNYPSWHKKEEAVTAMDTAMQHDFMRSLKKAPFLLMESCPSATNWQAVSKLKKPGMHEASSLQAVAHGSDSVLYFQLRQSRGASEKFHGAVIDHYGGDDTRVFRDVTRVGEDLEKLADVCGTETVAKVAVVYDVENRWAMEQAQGPRNAGLFYTETALKSYAAFRRQGLNVDVIDESQPLDCYSVVAMPMLYMLREGFADKVRTYVENGGRIIMTYWSGIVDETDLCFLGGTPGGLMDVLGLRSTEIDGLYDWEMNTGIPADSFSADGTQDKAYPKEDGGPIISGTKASYTCTHLCDLVRVSTAQPLLVYGSDFYKGWPALTVNRFGEGKAWYVCADFEQRLYDDLYRAIAGEAGIRGPLGEVPEGVEVTTRTGGDKDFIFIQNFRRERVAVALPAGAEILCGEYDGTIDSFGTVAASVRK